VWDQRAQYCICQSAIPGAVRRLIRKRSKRPEGFRSRGLTLRILTLSPLSRIQKRGGRLFLLQAWAKLVYSRIRSNFEPSGHKPQGTGRTSSGGPLKPSARGGSSRTDVEPWCQSHTSDESDQGESPFEEEVRQDLAGKRFKRALRCQTYHG